MNFDVYKNKCLKEYFDYTFIFNGQEYKADYCVNTSDIPYCYKDNVRYDMVQFSKVKVGEETIKCFDNNTFINLWIITLIGILFFIYILFNWLYS